MRTSHRTLPSRANACRNLCTIFSPNAVGNAIVSMADDLPAGRLENCLRRFQSDEEKRHAAREELIAIAMERMSAVAHRMLRGFPQVRRWEETDDVVQNAALRMHRALSAVAPVDGTHFLGLAILQIRWELMDLARKYASPSSFAANRETNVVRLDGDCVYKVELAEDGGATDADRAAAWTRFHEHAAALPDEERKVFDLVWYLGARQEEICRLLGASPRTVRRRWASAKQRLASQLGGEPLE